MTDYTKYYLKTRHGVALGIAKVNEKGVLHYGEIVDLLNSFVKENEQLKEELMLCKEQHNTDEVIRICQFPPIKDGRIFRTTTYEQEKS